MTHLCPILFWTLKHHELIKLSILANGRLPEKKKRRQIPRISSFFKAVPLDRFMPAECNNYAQPIKRHKRLEMNVPFLSKRHKMMHIFSRRNLFIRQANTIIIIIIIMIIMGIYRALSAAQSAVRLN